MCVDFPAVAITALVSLCVRTCLNVNPIRLQNVFGHGLQARRTIDLERYAPPGGPPRQDEVRIASRVIGVEVRHKSHLQVGRLDGRYVPVANSRLSAAHDSRSKI